MIVVVNCIHYFCVTIFYSCQDIKCNIWNFIIHIQKITVKNIKHIKILTPQYLIVCCILYIYNKNNKQYYINIILFNLFHDSNIKLYIYILLLQC